MEMPEVICINQLNRPKVHIQQEGVGNCTICKPDSRNVDCLHYMGVTIGWYEVEDY